MTTAPETGTAPETRTPAPDPLWRAADLDLDAYLARIGYDGPREATVDVLNRVHRAHTSTFPFENIDALIGVQPELDLASVQRKLVAGGRGGLCFELIVLFGAALERLGFPVTRMMARPLMGSREKQVKTHAALVVEAAGKRWLADVAFGGEGPQEAIEIFDGSEKRVGAWRWRLERRDDVWALRTMHPEGWFDLYEFGAEPCVPADFEMGNFFVCRSPRSKFNVFLLVQRGRPEIKHYVVGRKLVTIEPGGHMRHRDFEPEQTGAVLRETFQLALPDEIVAKLATTAGPGERPWD